MECRGALVELSGLGFVLLALWGYMVGVSKIAQA